MLNYQEIVSFSGDRTSVYIGVRSLAHLALDAFRVAIAASIGTTYNFPVGPGGTTPLSARLRSAQLVGGGGGASTISAELAEVDDEIALVTDKPVKFEFDYIGHGPAGTNSEILATLTMIVKYVAFSVNPVPDAINISVLESGCLVSSQRRPDFDEVVSALGLDPTLVTQIEGMLKFGGLQTTIQNCFADGHTVDLSKLFPGLSFKGSLKVGITGDRQQLLLTGSQGMALGSSCECAPANEYSDGRDPGDWQSNPQSTDMTNVGTITFGGPRPVNAARLPALLGRRGLGTSDTGIYMPNDEIIRFVSDVFPAVRVDFGSRGFVGYKAVGIVDLAAVRQKFEPKLGRFLITLDFRVEAYGSVHVDFGKLGKVRVCTFSAEQDSPGANSITFAFYLVIGTGGIYIKPVIDSTNYGPFRVHLPFTQAAGPFGTTAVMIAFVLDTILGRLIASQIPVQLDRAIQKWVGPSMITLMDDDYANEIEGTDRRSRPNRMALYDGGAEGFLFSAASVD